MKRIRLLCLISAALLAFYSSLLAQNQVLVTVNVEPPYSHRFADYEHLQVLLTLTNTTQQDLQMKVLGEITGQGTGFYVRTRPDYVPNQIITLGPGETRQFRGSELRGYFDRNNTEENIPDDVEIQILRSGLLPQDVYEYCIQVVDINTLAELGRRCTLIPVQYLTPPQPNLPVCGESYDLQHSPVITFSWLPPVGGGMGNASLRFDFYLAPVPEGQDPAQLLDLAIDGQAVGNVFTWTDIIGNQFQYNNLQLPALSPGLYVWGVVAHDQNGQVGIENEGKSQFCTLLIGNQGNNGQQSAGNQGNGLFPVDCSCKSPAQPPAGVASNDLLQVGTDIQVGAYTMRVLSTTGEGNGTGRISLPGFPGGITLPILVDFTDVTINGSRDMMSGSVVTQRRSNVGFLPEIADPQLATLPLTPSDIDQLDQYFVQNGEQLISHIDNALDASGYRLPIGLDKTIGGQQLVVAITDIYFDATRAALDAAVVLNLVDAGTKVVLSGRGICLKNGMGLCGEAELFLAENLELPALNMGLRGLNNAANESHTTRVLFDKDGFKRLHIEAFYRFPAQTLVRAQDGGRVEATLTADTEKGWSDWTASIGMDAFRVYGVEDFTFRPGEALYDHSSLSNPDGMPADYAEGQSPVWMGFFLKTLQVDLPPILKRRNSSQPLSGSANNVIIDGNGLSGTLNLNNILSIGEGGDGNWQFSVDRFTVKFLKNTFQSGGFEGHLLLPITSRGVQSQLDYSSLLSYSNSQFSYNFVLHPQADLEVDLFAALFTLANNSSITMSYTQADDFVAAAQLSGEFSIGGKFTSSLPRIQVAQVHFENLGLTTKYPYYTPGQLQATLGSPAKSVGGFPVNVSKWELVSIGLKATVDLQLSDHIGFLPNVKTAFTLFGKFENGTPAFDRFEMNRIELDADFSVLHVKGGLEFFSKDAKWGDGFQGVVKAVFPPGFTIDSRIQVGDAGGTDYWYVDGRSNFGGDGEDFVAGMDAFGFSGGAGYNMEMVNFREETDITDTRAPEVSALGSAPSGVIYQVKSGTSLMQASLVFGLSEKELFNVNGKMRLTFQEGGVGQMLISGKGRMFGDPGQDGMLNGSFSVVYDFPQKILCLHAGMKMNFIAFTGYGSLDTYSNGTTGDWHIKLGRPLDYGQPYSLGFDMGALDISASAYFQSGNFEVDGLPTSLPEVMMRIFPDYASRYGRADRSRTQRGDAILMGISLEAAFQQNYLIFYGRLRGAFGFDMLLQKVQGGCNNRNKIGMNGWYGNGQFYAGLEASIGIEVDLFFISGKFEILAIGFGGLLTGGGPDPTWMKGEVGGFYSILGGLVEGHCSFEFSVGDVCIPANDPLASLKVINEVQPKTRSQSDPQVDELQDIFLEPAASVNLRMGREFFLEETKEERGNAVTIPRLFKFDRPNLEVSFKEDKPNGAQIPYALEYDEDGFGLLVSPRQYLMPETNYIVTFTATVQECPQYNITTYSQQNIQEQGYSVLKSGTCVGGGWTVAKLQNNQPFREVRSIKFTTNGGPLRLDPSMVVYSLPQQGQRFYCYADFTRQAILALDDDKERVMTADRFYRPDRSQPCRLKLRLVPSGAEAQTRESIDVDVMAGGVYDPTLDQGAFGPSRYFATKAQNYWTSPLVQGPLPETTYGAQFYLEWDAPPGPPTQNDNRLQTTIKRTVLANGMAVLSERELNLRKYRLASNQREVYRYFFRTSRYSSIDQKLQALDRNKLVFSQLTEGASFPIRLDVRPPESQDWNLAAQKVRNYFAPDANDAGGIKGIYLSMAGYDGPEKFDIFDAYGFDRIVKNTRYRINPLISLDGGALWEWWNAQFEQAVAVLLQNGIRESLIPPPGIHRTGWVFTEPTMRINGILDSLTTDGALGSIHPTSLATVMPIGQFSMTQAQNHPQNSYATPLSNASEHLLEIRRNVERMTGVMPGAIPPAMNWINNVMTGTWVGASDGPIGDQLAGNIGAAYDFIHNLNQPTYNPQIGGGNIGGSLHINAMQSANAPVRNVINIGH